MKLHCTRLAALVLALAFASVGHGQTTVPRGTVPGAADGPSTVETLKPDDVKPPPQAAPSFQSGSGQRAGGPANELNTGDDRATAKLPGGSVADAVSGRDLYHGNFCGKGDRGAGLSPVDELDAACQRHDACYDRAGRPSCACDETLKQEALAVADTRSLSREARGRAASVAEAATAMQCTKP